MISQFYHASGENRYDCPENRQKQKYEKRSWTEATEKTIKINIRFPYISTYAVFLVLIGNRTQMMYYTAEEETEWQKYTTNTRARNAI